MPRSRQLISVIEAQAPFFVGVDVGGTSIKLGVVDDRGRPLSWQSLPTNVKQGPLDAVGRMAAAVGKSIVDARLQPAQIASVGLGVPGTFDAERGLLLSAANLPSWQDFPLRDTLIQACGLPVTFVNDAAAAGYGEFWVGTGQNCRSMVLFTLGTGVGGAIFVGDRSIDGDHGGGAELGHMIIDYNQGARLCPCGQRGHLEAYIGAGAIARRAEELVASGKATSLARRMASGQPMTPLVVAEEAEQGDAVATEIVLDTARYLGVGVVNVLHTIDPGGVVIGGAVTFGGNDTPLGRRFLETVQREVRQRAFPELAQQTTIGFASLGVDAGFIGAAGLARRAWTQKPYPSSQAPKC